MCHSESLKPMEVFNVNKNKDRHNISRAPSGMVESSGLKSVISHTLLHELSRSICHLTGGGAMYEITCTSPYKTPSILIASGLAMNTVASRLLYLYYMEKLHTVYLKLYKPKL